MKNLLLSTLLLFTLSLFSQGYQNGAPWMKSISLDKNQKPTILDVTKAADAYFNTIDVTKKGSGIKPFERWKYHWSFYTKPDGTSMSSSDFLEAWKEKQLMNTSRSTQDNSNWSSLGPFQHTNTASWSPGQGRVNCITIDPSNSNTYYVGAPAGGIWKSTDAGVNWTPLVDHLPQIGVSGIAVDPINPNTIYIATGDDDAGDSYSIGVWKSIDGGTSWNNTGILGGTPQSMNEIYIDPNNHETILVATNIGIFKSIDGGNTWINKLNDDIIDLKMKPGDATTWYAVSGSTFYRSTDSGESFNSVTITELTSSSRMVIDVTPANPEYVYMVSANNSYQFNGVYKSFDSGATFFKSPESDNIFESTQAWYDLALTVSDTNPETLYVGVLNIWKSIDGANDFVKLNNWSSPNDPNYTHGDIHFLRFIDGNFFAGTDGGIYRSSDHGDSFTNLTGNIAIGQFYKISVAAQNSENVVGGLQDNGGYAYSNGTWNVYHGADGMDCAVNALEPQTYYGFIQNGISLYATTDGGLTAETSVSAPAEGNGNWVTPLVSNSSGDIYAGYSQLYKLDKVNNVWEAVSNHNFGGDLDIIEISPDNQNFYLSKGVNLFRSTSTTTLGTTFEQVTFNYGTITSIEVNNNDPNILWVTTRTGVYKSSNILDANPTFTDITGNLPSDNKLIIRHHASSNNNTVYLGTTLGVYFINDDLTDWQVYDNNLPNVAITDLEINEIDAKLYAATYGRGVFVTSIAQSLALEDEVLKSNITVYPNPSDSDFNISWNLDAKASIKVYNYMGQLVFQEREISSNYKFYPTNFSRGIYFIKLVIDGKHATKKIILR